MATKQRRADFGTDRARRIVAELAAEVRSGRVDRGLSQRDVGRAVGLSPSAVSRLERGLVPDMSIRQAARLLAVVGLELSARAYPAGQPLRDRAHVALLERFRRRLNPSLTRRIEVPLEIPGDRRGWDAMVVGRGWSVPVEAETRVGDCQALARRIGLKARDSGLRHVLLVLADSRHHRTLLASPDEPLRRTFPMSGQQALERLAAGVDPGGSSIIIL